MQRKKGCHTTDHPQMRMNVKNVVKTSNQKLFVDRDFKDRPIEDSGNKVAAYCTSIQVHVTVHNCFTGITLSRIHQHVTSSQTVAYDALCSANYHDGN